MNSLPEQTQNPQQEYQPVQSSNTKTNGILIDRTPIQNKSGFLNLNYVSPSDICPVPKALPRNVLLNKNAKKISSYYFDTRKRTFF